MKKDMGNTLSLANTLRDLLAFIYQCRRPWWPKGRRAGRLGRSWNYYLDSIISLDTKLDTKFRDFIHKKLLSHTWARGKCIKSSHFDRNTIRSRRRTRRICISLATLSSLPLYLSKRKAVIEKWLEIGYCVTDCWFPKDIAGSSKGRTSLSESENFGSIPSPAAER